MRECFGPARRLRILLVEDDALTAMMLEELLSVLGHDVVEIAGTQAQAIAAATRLAPDLMIVDVNLADGDGPSAMRTVLAAGTMPHLFMTGSSRHGLPDGAVALRKPFQTPHLIEALALVLKVTPPESMRAA